VPSSVEGGPRFGEPCCTTAGRRARGKTPETATHGNGPGVVGRTPAELEALGQRLDHRPAGDRREMAPQGFKLYWRWKSRPRGTGRPRADRKIPELIRKMATENVGWGAPKIHGELVELGFNVSERTVSRYMPKRPVRPDAIERWTTFLRNHREVVAACDYFTAPTVTFDVLYVFFVIHHARRTTSTSTSPGTRPQPGSSSSSESRSPSTRLPSTSSSTATRSSARPSTAPQKRRAPKP
jgi:hypothetical protein